MTSVGSSRRPPEFHQHSTTLSLNPGPACTPDERGASGAWRAAHMEFGNQGPRRAAGIAKVNGAQSSRFSAVREGRMLAAIPKSDRPSQIAQVKSPKSDRPSRIAQVKSPEQPPSGIPAIQYLTYSQNVAGLWLKYGAKPRNKGVSLLSKIPLSM